MMRRRKHRKKDYYDYYISMLRNSDTRMNTDCLPMVVFVLLFGLLMVGGIIVHHYR
jgi:hypothetical protein